MPRIRTVKPEMWTSEQVAACSRDARLLFIGLWNFCDDGGVHPASAKRVKMEVFPGDDIKIESVETWIKELISNGLVEEYSVKEKKYWHVISWKNHQKIDRPNYRHPSSEDAAKLSDHSTNSRRLNDEDSTSIHPRNGKEWKGKEYIRQVADATRPVSLDESSSSAGHDDVQVVFAHWQQVMNKPKTKLDDGRRRKIKTALKAFSVVDCKHAIDGCAHSAFHMGKNDTGKRYDGISLIFRNPEKIEQFMAMTKTPENLSGTSLLPSPSLDLMQGAI